MVYREGSTHGYWPVGMELGRRQSARNEENASGLVVNCFAQVRVVYPPSNNQPHHERQPEQIADGEAKFHCNNGFPPRTITVLFVMTDSTAAAGLNNWASQGY